MLKRGLLFTMLLLSSVSLQAMPCAKSHEMEAVRVRALQTELMFAALSCNGSSSYYNRFIKNYRQELQTQAKTLRAYFKRAFAADAENQMNRFITRLANESSTRSLNRGLEHYCEAANDWFSDVESNRTLQSVNYRYRGNEIRSCR